MTPFRRGKRWKLYVPRESGGVVERACGTTDAKLAKAMGRMIDDLADRLQWPILRAIDEGIVTVAQTYTAYVGNRLDRLIADAQAPVATTLVDGWLATMSVAPRTLKAYRQKITRLLPDGMRLTAMSSGWIADTIAQLPFTSGTRQQYLHVFTLFLDYAVAHRYLPANPGRERALVRRPKSNKPRAVWKDIADDLALVNAAREPLRSFFALVHATGAERDAALAIRRKDIDLTAATVHIPGTKTATRDRRGVPIESWALPMLKAHCAGLLPDAPLFPTLSREIVNRAHVAARTVAKLDGYQLRDARHSYAVRALLRGEPLWKVSKWLGHSNVAITAKVYTQFGLDEAMESLGRGIALASK